MADGNFDIGGGAPQSFNDLADAVGYLLGEGILSAKIDPVVALMAEEQTHKFIRIYDARGVGIEIGDGIGPVGFSPVENYRELLASLPDDLLVLEFAHVSYEDIEIMAEALDGTKAGDALDDLLEASDGREDRFDLLGAGVVSGITKVQASDVMEALVEAAIEADAVAEAQEAIAEAEEMLSPLSELDRITEAFEQSLMGAHERIHQLQVQIGHQAREIEELRSWQDVSAQAWDRVFAYLQTVDETLISPRGMPIDDVRYVIERLLNGVEPEAPYGALQLLRMLGHSPVRTSSFLREFAGLERSQVIGALRYLEGIGLLSVHGGGWAPTANGVVFSALQGLLQDAAERGLPTDIGIAETALYEHTLLHHIPVNAVVKALEALSHGRLIRDLGGRWTILLKERN